LAKFLSYPDDCNKIETPEHSDVAVLMRLIFVR